ncbi:DUF1345 domain-containing protein [Sphingomonas sp. MAH-20]|uniref:DUF1345 domain-containing protein n=1 Tax=Sphingomonas horti TaxID=2682842 RepID=A0A6I4J2U1_9SPHN|nr:MULTISPECIES: DUF1345 domain-containing protein [Sphingomonas]MBA2918907.1 DUF1345 domain-containing protein [Sphingomonas sp. CGMCC 1.13658]MVO78940.1 DUF1345 domain-containing protein [Sphingomonas horti]
MRPVGTYLAPERFLAFLVVLALTTWLAAQQAPIERAAMIGFDVAALAFLLIILPLLRKDARHMRESSRLNDANRAMLLAVSGAVILAILVAIGSEVSQKDRLDALGKALVIATLALAWLFSNAVYALHYAHVFYLPDGNRDRGGLEFPGRREPDYADFFYFAFTLGMTFQTSDVSICSRRMRQLVLMHSMAAFVFNIGVLAFTINVLGS